MTLALWGPAVNFGINAVSYVAVLIALLMIDPTRLFRAARSAESLPVLRSLAEGVRYAMGNPHVLWPLVLLLGISMMMIVLDDSRVQVSRAEILNQLSRVIAISDEFQPIAELTLQELMGSTKAKAAWFRTLENGRLRLTASRGLPDAFMTNVGEIDISGTVTEELLRVGEVGVVPLEAAQP